MNGVGRRDWSSDDLVMQLSAGRFLTIYRQMTGYAFAQRVSGSEGAMCRTKSKAYVSVERFRQPARTQSTHWWIVIRSNTNPNIVENYMFVALAILHLKVECAQSHTPFVQTAVYNYTSSNKNVCTDFLHE